MISKDDDNGLNAGLDLRMLTPHSVFWISVSEDRAEHRRNQALASRNWSAKIICCTALTSSTKHRTDERNGC